MNAKPDLERLIGLIDSKLATLPRPAWHDSEARRHRHNLLETIVRELGDEAGGHSFKDGSIYTLRMAGVATSCTSGVEQLLRNWQTAARKRIAKEAGQ
jgi:hypothetical protein